MTTDTTNLNCAPSTLCIGDNYEFLRSLNNDCIDLIAIDPPFAANETFTSQPKPPITDDELLLERELAKAHGMPHDDDVHQDSGRQTRVKDIWRWDDSLHVKWKAGVREDYPAVFSVVDAVQACATDNEAAYIAFMAARLIECQRVLKPTGSIYLHCDDHANSYLRMLMDAIFGASNFRNQITWPRAPGRTSGRHWGDTNDTILFYSKSNSYVWKDTKVTQENTRPTVVPIDAAGTRNGESGQPWRGYDPTRIGRHWAVPRIGALASWIEANVIPNYGDIAGAHDRLDALYDAGLIRFSQKGRPSIIRPVDADAGTKVNSLWNDIKLLSATSRERTGYSLQKPLELYERIIAASSNEGDVVLDIFAGCATTAVAAAHLNRKWIACDIAYRAYTMLNRRFYLEGMHADPPEATKNALANMSKTLRRTAGVQGSGERTADAHVAPQLGTTSISIIGPKELPTRTDVDPSSAHELKVVRHDKATGWSGSIPKEEAKRLLIERFGAQCWGCGYQPLRPNGTLDAGLLEVDHIRARNAQDGVGGDDELYNLALLHPTCNKVKSNRMRTLEELRDHNVHAGTLWVDGRDELIDLFTAQQYAVQVMMKRGVQSKMAGV